jgi:hypothetical protein
LTSWVVPCNHVQSAKPIGLAIVREPQGEAKTPQTGTARAMHQTTQSPCCNRDVGASQTKTKTKSWCP